MTREEAIKALQYERKTALHENKTAFDMAIKALSAEPCEDVISFPKGTLKKRGKGYVVYNPELLKENWQTELKVMGIEFEDAISREQAIKECYSIHIDGETFDVVQVETLMGLPSVTPKQKMCFDGMTNGEVLISLYPNLKYTIQNGRVVTTIGVASSFDLDWWNEPYKAESEDTE